MTDNPVLYERLRNEGDREWRCFVHYRDQGPARSRNKTANDLRISFATIDLMSRQWGWMNRVMEWDNVCDRRKQAQTLAEIDDMRARHKRLAGALFKFSKNQIDKYIEVFEDAEVPVVKINDLVKLVDVAVRLERAVHGEPEAVIEVKSDKRKLRQLFDDPDNLLMLDHLAQQVIPETDA